MYVGFKSDIRVFERSTVKNNRCWREAGSWTTNCGALCAEDGGSVMAVRSSTFQSNGGPYCANGGAIS